jgi:hypothetical protein
MSYTYKELITVFPSGTWAFKENDTASSIMNNEEAFILKLYLESTTNRLDLLNIKQKINQKLN